MSSKKHYISSFTMMDVLMGMAIMSIVIAMAYYVMTAAQQQMYLFGSTRFELTQHVMHQQDLKRNFFESSQIKNLPNGFSISRNNEQVTYLVKENQFLRQTLQRTDTLWSHSVSVQKEFYTNHKAEITCDSVLKRITLSSEIGKQTLHTYLFKQYDHASLINQELIREF